MRTILTLLFLSICLISCNSKKEGNSIEKARTVNEIAKLNMFRLAYIHQSTAPYYVVATIKNKNTGEVKGICTEAPALEAALHLEFNKDYDYSFNLDSTSTRHFELSKERALKYTCFDSYTQEDLESYKQTLNIDSIKSLVKKEKHVRKSFTSEQCDKHEREMFAHIMFDYGIMMRRGCVAGNQCGLVLYDPTKIDINSFDANWDYY